MGKSDDPRNNHRNSPSNSRYQASPHGELMELAEFNPNEDPSTPYRAIRRADEVEFHLRLRSHKDPRRG